MQSCSHCEIERLIKENDRAWAEVRGITKTATEYIHIINEHKKENEQLKEDYLTALEDGLVTAGALEDVMAERDRLSEKYHDLLLQVQNVIPNEDRHDTAKRIIHEHENSFGSECEALNK
jgi:hypothetical protein